MHKLGKYLKKYWLALIAVVALLYLNAQTELALPNYMSRIISTGIQAGGIESSVVEAMDVTTYEHLLLLMDQEDQAIFEDAYTLYPILDEKLAKQYPNADQLYILNDLTADKQTQLDTVMREPLLMNYIFLNATDSEEFAAFTENIPDGMDIYQFLALLPEEKVLEIKAQVTDKLTEMGDSAAIIATSQAVQELYQRLGRDVEKIQMSYIFYVGLEMLGVALIGTVAFIAVAFLASRIAASISQVLRNEVFAKVSSFGNAEFNRFSTASLITRTTNDIQQIQNVVTMVLRIVVYAPIMGIGAIMRVMRTDQGMVWIIVMTVVILLVIIAITFSIVLPKFKIVQKTVDRLNLVMRENLTGMMVIRAFGNQKNSEERFDRANRDMTNLNLFVNRVMNSVMPLMMFILNCISLLIIWVGGHRIDLGYTNIGDMMAFMQYSMQIIMSFVMIAMIFVMLPRASVACDRVFEILETQPEVQDPLQTLPFDETKKGLVEFDHVSFAYPGAEENVLEDITFTAYPGKTTAIIGSTGSGKSTLIQLIPRFFDVSSGAVRVDGQDVRQVSMHDLRDKIGMVLQKGVLFSGTIASNLKFGKSEATDQDLLDASAVSQSAEFIQSKPNGMETAISQGGSNVSGGQKQRLAIARALVKDSEILVFDDSFSALDFKTDAKLRKDLNRLVEEKEKTVIIVGQRISTIMHADEIIVLDEGRVVGRGKHEDLLKNCQVYQEIAYSQLSKEELNHE